MQKMDREVTVKSRWLKGNKAKNYFLYNLHTDTTAYISKFISSNTHVRWEWATMINTESDSELPGQVYTPSHVCPVGDNVLRLTIWLSE